MLRYSAELQHCIPKDNGTKDREKAIERISVLAAFDHISLRDPPNDALKGGKSIFEVGFWRFETIPTSDMIHGAKL